MPRFFVSRDAFSDGTVTVIGDDAFHISHSLRMKVGELLTVSDGEGGDYECRILSVADSVTAEIISSRRSCGEPPYEAVLYQAFCKGDKFDTVVQKAVETGASLIVPVLTKRCTVRPDPRSLDGKLARWRRIAREASKQCGRGRLISVGEPMSFSDAVSGASDSDVPLFCYEGESTESLPSVLTRCNNPAKIAVMIGPEGGFDASEVDAARSGGLNIVGLGARILRTETASSFVLSCVSYEYELRDNK